MKRWIKVLLLGFGVLLASAWLINRAMIGTVLDEHEDIAVYYNGWNIAQSHGKHYDSESGYYFGHKWQCVEFVKRYYYLKLKHQMPDGWGHAKSFYDPDVADGKLNKKRGLLQYKNGGNGQPRPDDLVVFTQGTYGHVAIVTEVGPDYVELIQQNVFLKTRKQLGLQDGKIIGGNAPAGWLRQPK